MVRVTQGGAALLFPAWETFYVIVGSSAGALTGLMFVVIALIADVRGAGPKPQVIQAFGTPNVVHFGAALLLSIILAAPWPTIRGPQVALAMFGAAGAAYTLFVIRRARQQAEYAPVFEDWLFHAVLPLACYVGVLAGADRLAHETTLCLFVIGAAAVLLVFIGLHNAWDTVTYIVSMEGEDRGRDEGTGGGPHAGAS